MSHRVDRLQLIRERHRKVILEPREREEVPDVFPDWDDEDEVPQEDIFLETLLDEDEDDF
jgi:hypothetical protein